MATDVRQSPFIDISLVSRFWLFDLARELSTYGMLRHLHTGYPSFLTSRWGVPRHAVRSVWTGEPLNRAMGWLQRGKWIASTRQSFISERHDRIVASRLRDGANIFIGLSSQCRISLGAAKRLGMTTIVERGSTHIQWQYRELAREASLTGMEVEVPDQQTIERELAEYESADYIAVPSTFVAGTFTAAGVSNAKLLVNPYGVDVTLFSAAGSVQHEQRGSRCGLRVIHVGAVTARKGVHYLAEAVNRVPGASVTFVGSVSPDMSTCLGRYQTARMVGGVPGNDLPVWYREGDVFCLLSVEDGFGLVLLQAMAMGLPVIATSHTGAEDLIEDGVQGFIIPPRDAEAAAVCLQQLADAPELRLEMGARARARVAERFDWTHYGARARAHYARILVDQARRPVAPL